MHIDFQARAFYSYIELFLFTSKKIIIRCSQRKLCLSDKACFIFPPLVLSPSSHPFIFSHHLVSYYPSPFTKVSPSRVELIRWVIGLGHLPVPGYVLSILPLYKSCPFLALTFFTASLVSHLDFPYIGDSFPSGTSLLIYLLPLFHWFTPLTYTSFLPVFSYHPFSYGFPVSELIV